MWSRVNVVFNAKEEIHQIPTKCLIPIKLFIKSQPYNSFKVKIEFEITFGRLIEMNETFIFPKPCKYKDDKYRRDIVR